MPTTDAYILTRFMYHGAWHNKITSKSQLQNTL